MKQRKGIILAGGNGSRLYPLTTFISKHLLPVYDKPMIYYPLTTLMLAGIRDILLIATARDLPLYQKLLADGAQWGLNISYREQRSPGGLPQAYSIGEDFVKNYPSVLILGDNIFYGYNLRARLLKAAECKDGAQIFAYQVKNPQAYGVVQFDFATRQALSIEEKPQHPKSQYAIPGLYFYDEDVIDYVKALKPSARGELEIADLNNIYLQQNKLQVEILGRGTAWFDGGTHDELLQASMYIGTLEARQGLKVGVPEEVAYRLNYINAEELEKLAQPLQQNGYGAYLLSLLEENLDVSS